MNLVPASGLLLLLLLLLHPTMSTSTVRLCCRRRRVRPHRAAVPAARAQPTLTPNAAVNGIARLSLLQQKGFATAAVVVWRWRQAEA